MFITAGAATPVTARRRSPMTHRLVRVGPVLPARTKTAYRRDGPEGAGGACPPPAKGAGRISGLDCAFGLPGSPVPKLRGSDGGMTESGTGAVYISLQAPGYEDDAVGGHRAAGILAASDLVIIPRLPRQLVDELLSYSVLFVPVPGAEAEAEPTRIRCSQAEAHAVGETGDVVAIVQLEQPAGYEVPLVSDASAEALASSFLEHGGDYTPGLVALGFPGASASQEDPQLHLGDAGEALLVCPPDSLTLHSSIGGIFFSLCRWVRFCDPAFPEDTPPTQS